MAALLDLYLEPLLVFVTVLTRISGLMLMAPIYGSRSVPLHVRGLLAVALAALVVPLHWNAPIETPNGVLSLLVVLAREGAVGLALGLGVNILFGGLQIAGQVASQLSGTSLADVLDPNFDSSVPLLAQLMDSITLMVFLAIGGHRYVMGALLDTFQWMPPGEAFVSAGLVEALVEIVSQSFVLGLRAGAPMMVALLVSVLTLGIVSRTLPQLNVLAMGFNMNTILALVVLALSLGGIVWLFQEQVEPTIDTLRQALSRPAA
jgi:flagellar biosynthetic protein FliR